MDTTLICGRSYYQAMMYARSAKIAATRWTFVADPDKIRGLRGSGLKLVALPGSPSDVIQQARVEQLEIRNEPFNQVQS